MAAPADETSFSFMASEALKEGREGGRVGGRGGGNEGGRKVLKP
jgi:hypothetical protein